MDFDLSEEQVALRDLALQVFSDWNPPTDAELISAFDDTLWNTLANTGLLGVAVPAEHGGLGFGATEAALIMEGYGHALAPIPLHETLVASLVLTHYGTPEQQAALLPGIADGSIKVSLALEEWGTNNPQDSSVAAVLAGSEPQASTVLNGTKPAASWLGQAQHILVPVRTDAGLALAIVAPDAFGLAAQHNETTNYQPEADLTFSNVAVDHQHMMAHPQATAGAVSFHRVLNAGLAVGACDRAVAITVEHANTREQFGKPLATNQAYSQRLADASIAIDCMRVTMLQAAWMLDSGQDAQEEVLIAAWWAADGGSQIVHATQHLHGGTGADTSYPVHRQYLAVKHRATTLGSASSHLAHLGDLIAGGNQ